MEGASRSLACYYAIFCLVAMHIHMSPATNEALLKLPGYKTSQRGIMPVKVSCFHYYSPNINAKDFLLKMEKYH